MRRQREELFWSLYAFPPIGALGYEAAERGTIQ